MPNQGGNSCYLEGDLIIAQIGITANQARVDIQTAILNNQIKIDEAHRNIQPQLTALNIKLDQASGPNAGKCILNSKLALAQLNVQELDTQCRQKQDIILLNNQVAQINMLKRNVNLVCKNCGWQYQPLSEEYQNCVANGFHGITKQLESLQSSVSSGVEGIQEKATQCVSNAQTRIKEGVAQISIDFDLCINV